MPMLRVPVSADVMRQKLARICAHLHGALGETTFPAARWELLIACELYGADWRTRQVLRELPAVDYADLHTVAATIDRLGLSAELLGP